MVTAGRTILSAFREAAQIPREARRHRPTTPAEGLVVEIGGGQSPHPRTDLVIDRYVVDDFEREGAISLTKPLVVGDGHRLPLGDGAADYVLTLHVLEHATDPALFASEMSRVARAGFAQVPSREAELTYGWPFHPWLIDKTGEVLVFEPKGTLRAHLSQFFHADFEKSTLHRIWWSAHRSRWLHSVEWEGRLDVQVTGTSSADATAHFDLTATVKALEQFESKGLLTPLSDDLRVALACPACRAQLDFDERHAECAGCQRQYPVAGGVPILLVEAASAPDADRLGFAPNGR
jgi:uncharacterized protein YbaR (Trm112 family)